MADTAAARPEPDAQKLGVQLAAHRHSARTYARSIVKRWPALTAAQRAEVTAILSPLVGRTEAGR